MIHTFPELVIGGVLIAPFVKYAAVALVLFLPAGLSKLRVGSIWTRIRMVLPREARP